MTPPLAVALVLLAAASASAPAAPSPAAATTVAGSPRPGAPGERELGIPLYPGAQHVPERSSSLDGLMFRDVFRTAATRAEVVRFYEERLAQPCGLPERVACTFYVDHLTTATRRGATVVVAPAQPGARATEFEVTTYAMEPARER